MKVDTTKIVAKYKKTGAATEVVEKATDSMTTKETTEKVIDAVKEQTAKAKVKGVGRKELDEIVENELREKGYSQAHVQYKEKLTKVQRKAIRENNKKVREIHSKAHQIGEKAKGAEKLQEVLNPKNDEILEKAYGDAVFREGDRVMQIKNNYDIYWEKGSRNDLRTYESGTGVFNGEIGRIIKISNEERQIQVLFDDGKVTWYAYSELDQLEHAYTITIHKAQGSEFDVVILVVPQSSNMLLTRNLLYTGITRAKKLLIVIGNKNLIEFMINNCDTKKRNTGLRIKFESID